MRTCRAPCAERFGRNPKPPDSMSASKTGSSTIFTAACTMRSRTDGIDSGLNPLLPGLGMNTRRAGNGRWLPPPSSPANSPSRRATPCCSTWSRVVLSMPGAPSLRRAATHARHKTSLRKISSRSAWNRRPGSALAARYSACAQGANRINDRSRSGGTSQTGTHRAPPQHQARRRSSGPSHHRRLCCPLGSTGTTAASDPLPASDPFPEIIGYRTPRSDNTTRRSPDRGGPLQFPPPPSERSEPHTPGSSSRLQSRRYTASMAFTPISKGSALPSATHNRQLSNDAAGFASRYGPLSRSPIGPSTLASTRPVSRPSRQSATGPPGSYPDRTHTGRRRRAYERRSTTYMINPRSTGRTEKAH